MDIEETIQQIVDNGKIEDMETLSDMLEDTMEIIKEYDEDCYKKFEMKLYKMAYGETLNKEMAQEIVSKMRPYRERWTYEDTKQMQEQYGATDIRPVDFYIVVNSAYNDYKDLFGENIDNYIKFTLDFIEDEDAKQGKVFKYFTTISNN